MGIENRDYLRDDDSNWSIGRGRGIGSMSIVKKLVIANVVVFIAQMLTASSAASSLIATWGSLDSVSVFRQGQVWRLLTYAFCHDQGNLLHIVFNMYMLYMLGQIVVNLTGEREFLWFYLASAAFAGLCSIVFYSLMKMPVHVIGASGAVLSVFMLFAMHYPRQQLYIFGIIPIEVRWLLAIYIAIDAWPTLQMLMADGNRRPSSMVAHSAHLGGLLFGFLYFKWNMRFTAWWDRFAGRFPRNAMRRRNLRVYSPGNQPDTSSLQEAVDEILAKISREGEASLTSRERNILTNASRQMRERGK